MFRRLTSALGLSLSLCGDFLPAAEKPTSSRTDSLDDPLPAGAVARLGSTRLWRRG